MHYIFLKFTRIFFWFNLINSEITQIQFRLIILFGFLSSEKYQKSRESKFSYLVNLALILKTVKNYRIVWIYSLVRSWMWIAWSRPLRLSFDYFKTIYKLYIRNIYIFACLVDTGVYYYIIGWQIEWKELNVENWCYFELFWLNNPFLNYF